MIEDSCVLVIASACEANQNLVSYKASPVFSGLPRQLFELPRNDGEVRKMKIAKVIVPKLKLFPLDYEAIEGLSIGQLVVVPYRNEDIVGVVLSLEAESNVKSLKPVKSIYPHKVSESFLKFLCAAAKYYFSEIGSIFKMVLPMNLADIEPKMLIQNIATPNLIDLSEDQTKALKQIGPHTTLLHGQTGSGKTEIYFHKMLEVMREGKQALFMIPEIALSRQMITRFEERFGEKAIIWNASVGKSRKQRILKSIMSGDIKIIIGARSALFLPYRDLGLIVVDEEHDGSYKQEDTLPYNARDMAVLRGSICNIPVILGSATPSLESFYNVQNKRYDYIKLESRFAGASLPKIIPINMKKEIKGRWISDSLKESIESAIFKGHQAMLYLNRKGYAPLLVCNECGYKPYCDSCSSSLVYHKGIAKLICHHCGYSTKYEADCVECKSENSMIAVGPGIERILEEAESLFPNANIQIMTKEEMNSVTRARQILEDVESGKVDIIIGTQIITKGYHFPKLTTVGVIDTDIALSGSELRTAESSFALLYQLAGRAGREEDQGYIYMQTYSPESRFIKQLQEHDFEGFIKAELEERKKAKMPPIYKIASIILQDKNEIKVKRQAVNIVRSMKTSDHIQVLGPAPAFMSKLKNFYRYRIIIIGDSYTNLHNYLVDILNSLDKKTRNEIRIDIDPYSFG